MWWLNYYLIIPHMNLSYIEKRLIFYTITCCHSDSEYCHPFAIAADDSIKYQLCDADERTICLCNDRYEGSFGNFELTITLLFVVRNIKCVYLF